MEKNVLGINEDKLEILERKLVASKLEFLDEYCTFNEEKYDHKYLLKLNRFLFGDLYENLGYRTEMYNSIIDGYLFRINEICMEDKDISKIFDSLQSLWNLQPFEIGNTRTFVAFIKIINESYNLGLNINLNTDMYSGMNLIDIIEKKKSL